MLGAMTRPFFTSDIRPAQSPNLEAADRHDEGFDFAVLVDEHVTDLADLGVGRIIDVLTGLELIATSRGEAIRDLSWGNAGRGANLIIADDPSTPTRSIRSRPGSA
jgi:hypothetical protein